MNNKFFFFGIISVMAFAGCSKPKDTPTKIELLTSGAWMVTAVKDDDDGDGIYETDPFPTFVNCWKDNYYTFHPNSVFELNEGATKCDPADPQTFTSTWQLTNNETELVIHLDSYSIEELSNSTLRLKLALSHNRSSMITYSKR